MYRESIDRVHGSDTRSDPQTSITVAQLLESLPEGSSGVITELDMVDQVFTKIDSSEVSHPFFLAVIMAYAHSLLSLYIYPHKRLQSYMFELCVSMNNFACLQQLINFHVILDSPELLERLHDLEKLHGTGSWISQARLDTAKRMKRTDIVINCLMTSNRSDEIVGYIRSHDPEFSIDELFSLLSAFSTRCDSTEVWKQIELWNVSSDTMKPRLSQNVVLSAAACDD